MKKDEHRAEPSDEMQPEYDFRGGVRGKYAERYAAGSNVVVLEPDVAEVFPDSESVNQALRVLANLVKKRAAATGAGEGRLGS
jgi:hypothetical protein